jgi:hypothetical protein
MCIDSFIILNKNKYEKFVKQTQSNRCLLSKKATGTCVSKLLNHLSNFFKRLFPHGEHDVSHALHVPAPGRV